MREAGLFVVSNPRSSSTCGRHGPAAPYPTRNARSLPASARSDLMNRSPDQEAKRAHTDAILRQEIDRLGETDNAKNMVIVVCAVSRIQQSLDEAAEAMDKRMEAQTSAMNRIASALENVARRMAETRVDS